MLYTFFLLLPDGLLLLFLEGLLAFLEINASRLNIFEAAVTVVRNATTLFRIKFLAVAEHPNHGPGDIAAKDTARGVLETILSEFVSLHIRYNKAWTKEDLINAGFPASGQSGRYSEITETLVVSLLQKTGGRITAHGKCQSIKGAGMAPFADIIEFDYGFKNADGTWPIAGKSGSHVITFISTAPINVDRETYKGQELIVYGRYLNHVQKETPWSAPVTIFIT
ncbi:hypothetical protein FACS1894137_18240 [Spirochaetia bacterium]|nr:hypothetical protein FACS1894137_18240 [Spirochaetia bacterium]